MRSFPWLERARQTIGQLPARTRFDVPIAFPPDDSYILSSFAPAFAAEVRTRSEFAMNYSVYHPRLLTSALPVHPIRSFALRSIDGGGGGNYDGSESELNWRGSSIAVRIHGGES